jgi:hypothetical protein
MFLLDDVVISRACTGIGCMNCTATDDGTTAGAGAEFGEGHPNGHMSYFPLSLFNLSAHLGDQIRRVGMRSAEGVCRRNRINLDSAWQRQSAGRKSKSTMVNVPNGGCFRFES